MIVPLSLFGLTVVMLIVLWRRGNQVCDYRSDLRHKVWRASLSDPNRGLQEGWRYDAFKSVSYERMAWWRFWRPLDSFYPDRSFIDPEAPGPQGGKR